MKRNKKLITAVSFALGACLFVSTAFADMSLGTGYDRLKHSMKHTSAQMEHGLDNYTTESLLTLKVNGQVIAEASNTEKFDNVTKATENTSISQESNGKIRSHYSYSDPTLSIWKSSENDKYYVSEYPEGKPYTDLFTDPFQEEGAAEVEKIIDALVGNLKDAVQAEEQPGGGYVYSGTLTEAQVPALVNAVSSFALKQMIQEGRHMEEQSKLPEIKSDISIRKVAGKAVENEAGILESLTGEVVFAGKDDKGAQHEISLNVVLQLTDIGTTQVSKPDLSGAEVEKVSYTNGFSSKHIGTYKNNIIIEKDGKFVKIGERTLEITSIDGGKVIGKYYETIDPAYQAEYPEVPYDFTFEYEPEHSRPIDTFTYTNADGEVEHGTLHPGGPGKMWLDLNLIIMDEHSYRSGLNYDYFDSEFHLVFE